MSTTCMTEGAATRIDDWRGFQLVKSTTHEKGKDAGMERTDSLTKDLAEDLDAAFESLVRAFQDRLFSFARRLSRDREDAEEAAILKQPLGTAKSNVHRAVNLLRRAITDSRRAERSRS